MKASHNVAVNYNEGLFYVDFKNIYMYHQNDNPATVILEKDLPEDTQDEYSFDAAMSQANFESFKTKFTKDITTKFPSIQPTDEWLDKSKTRHVIMSNKLFNIVIEDNNWSLAVELTMVPKGNQGLQSQMFPSVLKGIRESLLSQFDTIYARNGSWSTLPITKESPEDFGNTVVFSYTDNDEEETETAFIPEYELLSEF